MYHSLTDAAPQFLQKLIPFTKILSAWLPLIKMAQLGRLRIKRYSKTSIFPQMLAMNLIKFGFPNYLFTPLQNHFLFQQVFVIKLFQNVSSLGHQVTREGLSNKQLICPQQVLLSFKIIMNKLQKTLKQYFFSTCALLSLTGRESMRKRSQKS